MEFSAEVLAMRLSDPESVQPPKPLAISEALLRRNPIFHCQLSGRNLVVMTSLQGANRVYDGRYLRVVGYPDKERATD